MDKTIPEFVNNVFKGRLSLLCCDLQQVECLLQSQCEWERAGAVTLFATQFDLAIEVVKEKLDRCLDHEDSDIVKVQLSYFISQLEVDIHFKEINAEILSLSEANFTTQLLRIQKGTHVEKLGAIKFAELRNESDPIAAKELYEYALLDGNCEIRCLTLRAMSEPYVGTANKEIGAMLANLALNEKETNAVRVCAARRLLFVFKPVGISRSGIQIMPPLYSEMRLNLFRMGNLIKLGVDGIDREFIESCIKG